MGSKAVVCLHHNYCRQPLEGSPSKFINLPFQTHILLPVAHRPAKPITLQLVSLIPIHLKIRTPLEDGSSSDGDRASADGTRRKV